MNSRSHANEVATIFGGSGFVGRHTVRALAKRGWRIRSASRRPDLAGYLQPMGDVGQIMAVQANLRNADFAWPGGGWRFRGRDRWGGGRSACWQVADGRRSGLCMRKVWPCGSRRETSRSKALGPHLG